MGEEETNQKAELTDERQSGEQKNEEQNKNNWRTFRASYTSHSKQNMTQPEHEEQQFFLSSLIEITWAVKIF